MKVLDRLLRKYSNLVHFSKGNAIDPAQVRAADKEVRDSVFLKIDNCIKLLKSMEKVKCENYTARPKANLYNMDEMTTENSNTAKKSLDPKLL